MRPTTPLMRLEHKKIEWTAVRNDLLLRQVPTAVIDWLDETVRDVIVLIDGERLKATIDNTAHGVYSETVRRQMEELLARAAYRRAFGN